MKYRKPITSKEVEALKAKHGIDQRIADRWGKSEGVIKDEYDPRLVEFIIKYLHRIGR